MKRLLSLIPRIYLAVLGSNIFYLSIISIVSFRFSLGIEVMLRVLLGIIVWWFLSRRRLVFEVKKITFEVWCLLFLILLVVVLRFPLYFALTDDLGYHLIAGDYARSVWNNNNFLAINYATYLYPAADMTYTPLWFWLGIRGALLVNSLMLGWWLVSLACRYMLVTNDKIKKRVIGYLFIYIYFVPHLVATQVSFMTDFLSVLLFLEAFWQIKQQKDKTMGIVLGLVSIIIKQSTGLFLVPIFGYLLWENRREIKWKWFSFLVLIILIFFIRCYFETGNPVALLLNNFFKSPLYPASSNLDSAWGPVNLFEVVAWPIYGQFTDRYAEGLVGIFSKIFYCFYTAVPYLWSVMMMFRRREAKYFVIFLSFLFWSKISGYGRYHLALTATSWLWLIMEVELGKWTKTFFQKKFLIWGLSICCLFSIKTDYGWRPLPNRDWRGYLGQYRQGLRLVFKDRPSDFLRTMRQQFDKYEVIMTNNGGQTKFISYIAGLDGKRLVDAKFTQEDFEKILTNLKVSEGIANNLKTGMESKKVLFLTEPEYEKEIDELMLFKTKNCQKVGSWEASPLLQREYFFMNTVKYDCE